MASITGNNDKSVFACGSMMSAKNFSPYKKIVINSLLKWNYLRTKNYSKLKLTLKFLVIIIVCFVNQSNHRSKLSDKVTQFSRTIAVLITIIRNEIALSKVKYPFPYFLLTKIYWNIKIIHDAFTKGCFSRLGSVEQALL